MNLSTPNSTQRKKSSASKADSRDEISSNTSNAPEMPMPLKHEIEDLINKEKTLLQLQLLDQELEAELWKSKYDELKEKVIEDVMEEEEEVKLYETLANLEDQEINNYYIPTDPNYLLISHVEHMIGNFSYVNFTQEVFFRVMKELFSPRKSSSYLTDADGAPLEVNILWLDHCQLGPRFADTINNILKNPKLDAIDLSHNNINAEMAIPLISILANRRKTPQYLLLHGNMPYASQAKTFTDFFKVLSEDTWGFSISLQDYSNLRKETKEKESENTKRRGKKDETMSYRDHTKPPMKAHAFLKGLSDHLYKLKTSTGEEIIEKKKQRQQSLKNGQISNRSLFPFRYLMVLGITDCHLSRQSIDLLQDTYEYLRENLTELDLSYCYMGLYGLEMIESIIRDKHSQLISLNLKGNVLPDLAAIKISESMRKNVTLTNLNLSSNLISMTSVRQMMNILAKSLTLHRLDLRNNQPPFLAADVMEVQFKLQEHASLVHVILQDDYELMDSMPRHQQNAHLHLPPPPHPNPLLSQMMKIHPKFYCQPQLRKKYCSVGKAKRIMEIDFNALSLQYPRDYFMQPFILQWFFRPMPIVSFDQVQKTLVQNIHKRVDYTVKTVTRPSQSQSLNASTTGLTASTAIDTTLRDMNNTDRGSSGGKRVQKKILFEDPFLHINELFKICFEIRLLKQNRIIWSYDKPFHINNLQNRNFFTTSMDWYHYYEIIPKLFQDEQQLNTLHQHKLQIRLKCVPTDLYRREQYEFDSTMKALHFHLKQCFLTHFMIGSGNRYYYLGGDPKDTNDDADIILFHHHHHYSSVTRQRHQHLFNLERNLALQEAFERETRLVLFDDAQLWFHQHILLRCFEFHFAHITRRCKIRWSSKLYVKQFTGITSEGVEGGDEENFFSDNEDEDDSAEEELQDDKNKTLKKTTTSVKKESNKKSRQSRYYPFKLDYTELIEESDLPETFERENRSDNDHLLVGGVEEAEEEEETMAYEELLELDANKKRPKFFDFITYEWTVSVYEAISQKRRIIQTVCCDYQVEDLADLAEDQYEQRKRERDIQGIFEDDEDEDDEDEQDDEGEGGRAAMGQLLLPWMWESFEVEIDDLRPSDLVILSGRVLQRSLDEVTEEYSHRATNKAPPRKKDLSRLMKYLSVQVKEFESYLFIEEDLHEVSSQRASAMVPFIYPPSAIYGLPSYDLPYERFIRTNAILYEAEHDLHLPQYQQYFMSQPDQEEETVEEIDDAIHASSLKSTNSLLMRSRKVNTNMLRSRTTLNRKIAEMTQAEQTIPSFSQGEIERKASTSKSPSRRSQKNTNTMSSATMNEDERSNSRRGISIGSDSANAIVGERENITF